MREVCLFIVALVLSCGSVFSQGRSDRSAGDKLPAEVGPRLETPSQRWLPLPPTGASDLQQQFRMLQQLRNMISAPPQSSGTDDSSPPTASDSEPPPSSQSPSGIPGLQELPEFGTGQLKQLQEMMERFGGQTPSGNGGDSSNRVLSESFSDLLSDPLMQRQISKAWSDPKLRKQAHELLERFSRERTIPAPNSEGEGRAVPFPTDPNESSSDAGGDPGTANRTLDATEERAAQSDGDSSADLMREFLQSPDAQGPLADLLKRLMAARQAQDENRPIDQDRRTDAGNRGANQIGKGVGRGNEAGAADRGTGTDRAGGVIPEHAFSDEDSVPEILSSPADNVVPLERSQSSENETAGEDRRRPEVFPGRNPESRRAADVAPQNRPASGDGKSPMDVSEELERNGFGKTLQKIVEQAAKEGRKRPQPASPGESSLGAANSSAASDNVSDSEAGGGILNDNSMRSLIRMLDGLGHDLKDIAKDARFREANGSAGLPPNPQKPEKPKVSRSAEMPKKSRLQEATKAADDFLSSLFKAPTAPAGSAAQSGSSAWIPPAVPSADGTAMILLAVIVCLLILLLAYRRGQLFPGTGARMGVKGLSEAGVQGLRTREDLVRIFHQLVLARFRGQGVNVWWTHKDVAAQVIAAVPAAGPAMEKLAGLYEAARYLPESSVLSSEQIQEARQAIEQCEARCV